MCYYSLAHICWAAWTESAVWLDSFKPPYTSSIISHQPCLNEIASEGMAIIGRKSHYRVGRKNKLRRRKINEAAWYKYSHSHLLLFSIPLKSWLSSADELLHRKRIRNWNESGIASIVCLGKSYSLVLKISEQCWLLTQICSARIISKAPISIIKRTQVNLVRDGWGLGCHSRVLLCESVTSSGWGTSGQGMDTGSHRGQ